MPGHRRWFLQAMAHALPAQPMLGAATADPLVAIMSLLIMAHAHQDPITRDQAIVVHPITRVMFLLVMALVLLGRITLAPDIAGSDN